MSPLRTPASCRAATSSAYFSLRMAENLPDGPGQAVARGTGSGVATDRSRPPVQVLDELVHLVKALHDEVGVGEFLAAEFLQFQEKDHAFERVHLVEQVGFRADL